MKNRRLFLLGYILIVLAALAFSTGWCFGADATAAAPPPPLDWANLIPLVATPAIISLIKIFAPRIPKVALPALAPVLGAGLEITCYYAGADTTGTVWGAVLGAAGVWLRECIDQVKKIQVPPAGTAITVCLALLLTPGCSSIPVEQQVTDMATIAELAAYTGSKYDLIENPDHRPFYEASVAALDSLIKAENYDPTAFAAALQKLPVRELKDDKGALIVGAAVILWDNYAARVVNLDKTTYVKPVIAAVRRGLSRALGQS